MLFRDENTIKPKDNSVLGNLLEVYLILGLFDKFDSKIEMYKKMSVESSEELTYLYLLTLEYLAKEHLGEARKYARNTIQFVNDNPGVRDRFYWSNDDLLRSDLYGLLSKNTQDFINNFFNYLKRQLVDEQEKRFVEGHYEDIVVAQTGEEVQKLKQ